MIVTDMLHVLTRVLENIYVHVTRDLLGMEKLAQVGSL